MEPTHQPDAPAVVVVDVEPALTTRLSCFRLQNDCVAGNDLGETLSPT